MLPPTPPPGRETLAEPTVLGWLPAPLPPACHGATFQGGAKGLTVDTSAAGLAPAVSPPVTPPRPIGCHGGACTMAGCAGKKKHEQPRPFSRSPANKWIRLTCYATKEQPAPIHVDVSARTMGSIRRPASLPRSVSPLPPSHQHTV